MAHVLYGTPKSSDSTFSLFPLWASCPPKHADCQIATCMMNLGEVENAKGTTPGSSSPTSSFLAEA